MKKQAILTIVLAAATATAALGQTVDNRPLLYPQYLNQKNFADLGLWFWVNDSHHPPVNIWVDCYQPWRNRLCRAAAKTGS